MSSIMSKGFKDFLGRIREKEKVGADRIRIYPVAGFKTKREHAVASYYKKIEEDCKSDLEIFYLIACEDYYVVAATALAELLSEDKVALIDEKYTDDIKVEGKKVKVAAIRMRKYRPPNLS